MQAADLASSETAPSLRVSTRVEACRLVDEMSTLMRNFGIVLDDETAHLRAGRVRQALEIETRKSEFAGRYLRAVQSCRANAVALARFAPAEMDGLKSAHADFQRAVERNQVVLATARAVSESLVRGLADEMARLDRPQTYGAGRQVVSAAARPTAIACSRSI